MPRRIELHLFENTLHFEPEQRDVFWALAVRERGEQSDEAPFASGIALVVIHLDANVVEVTVTMDGGSGIRFGDDQRILGAGDAHHRLGQLHHAAAAFVLRQDTETTAFDGGEEHFLTASSKFVFAISQEREVIVRQPLQQGVAFHAQCRISGTPIQR